MDDKSVYHKFYFSNVSYALILFYRFYMRYGEILMNIKTCQMVYDSKINPHGLPRLHRVFHGPFVRKDWWQWCHVAAEGSGDAGDGIIVQERKVGGKRLSPLMSFKSLWSESHKLTAVKQVAPMESKYEFYPRELGGMRTSHVCSLNFIKKTFSLFPNYITIATNKHCWWHSKSEKNEV